MRTHEVFINYTCHWFITIIREEFGFKITIVIRNTKRDTYFMVFHRANTFEAGLGLNT